MITIPNKETKKFSQPNFGDTQGNLWGTFNVDLTKNSGRVRVPRTQSIFIGDDGDGYSTVSAFAYYDINKTGTPVYIAYGQSLLIGGAEPNSTFTLDALINSPVGTGDMKVFNTKLYVSDGSKIKRFGQLDTAWVDVVTSSSVNHLCNYSKRLYFVNSSNKVHSMNTAETVVTSGDYTLDLFAFSGSISWIVPGSNRIWIGLTKNDGSRGMIFEWDGVSENAPNKFYYLEAQGSCACAIWNDVPYVMDIEGRLLAFNGSGFQEVARLPVLQSDYLSSYVFAMRNNLCRYNGMIYSNDAILININNSISGGIDGSIENFPSGIYEYTKENGLTHRSSPSITTSTGSTVDYGQSVVLNTGALFDATVNRSISYNYASILSSANCYDATGGNDLMYINLDVIERKTGDTEHNRLGYIITPFIESTKIKDVWQKIIIKYKKMLDSTDNIIVKYRTDKNAPVVIQQITWTDDTSFTDSSALIANLNVGDEIEVLTGNGAGDYAHILSIVDNGADYTITLDKSIIGVVAGNISDVRFQTWKKLPQINKDDFQFKELTIPQYNKSTEIQFKVIMNWTKLQNELREIIVVNETEQHAK